jgi:hypothetical protein
MRSIEVRFTASALAGWPYLPTVRPLGLSMHHYDTRCTMKTKTLKGAIAGAVGAAALAVAPSAFASDFCVGTQSCADFPQPDVGAALIAAKSHPGDDRVVIGPGNYTTASGFAYLGEAGNDVEVVGAGRGSTILQSTGGVTFQLARGSVHDLGIAGPTGGLAHLAVNLLSGARAERVVVAAPEAGVMLQSGSSIDDVAVSAPHGIAVDAASFSHASVSRTIIEAEDGAGVVTRKGGQLTVERSQIRARETAISAGDLHVRNSLLFVIGKDGAFSTAGNVEPNEAGSTASLTVTGSTLIGNGKGTQFGVAGQATASGRTSDARVENSVLSGFAKPLYRRGLSGGVANLTVRYTVLAGGTIVNDGGPGAHDVTDHVQTADPKFVDGEFRPAADSPLVDAGTSDATDGLGPVDVGGEARVADGDGDGVAAPDIGAHELPTPPAPGPETPQPPSGEAPQQQPATAPSADRAPVIKRFRLRPRRIVLGRHTRGAFRLSLSEDARVTIVVKRVRKARSARKQGALRLKARAGANRLRFRGRIKHRALKPGRYLAVAKARDSAGQVSARRKLSFSVVGH